MSDLEWWRDPSRLELAGCDPRSPISRRARRALSDYLTAHIAWRRAYGIGRGGCVARERVPQVLRWEQRKAQAKAVLVRELGERAADAHLFLTASAALVFEGYGDCLLDVLAELVKDA